MFRPICPLAFLRCFMLNSGVHTESQTESFIWTTRVDCSNSVNHDQVQVLSYSKYSLLFLPVVGIEPATSQMISLGSTFQPNALSPAPCVLAMLLSSYKGFSSRFLCGLPSLTWNWRRLCGLPSLTWNTWRRPKDILAKTLWVVWIF